jgi:hypothetical protein
MSATEIWGRAAHVGFALALLGGLAALAGALIGPSTSASTNILRVPVALLEATPAAPDTPDVSLAACERHPPAP